MSIHEDVRRFALSLPGAWEDHPWGETVAKVGKKVFVFLGHEGSEDRGMGVKLPDSGAAVLLEPYAEPSGYGLGKAGWVNIGFDDASHPPLDVLEGWIEESWRAIAPKKLIKEYDAKKGR